MTNALRILALTTVMAASFHGSPALADETIEVMSGVLIEAATATPALAGGTTLVHFSIDNASGQDLTLTGVRSDMARTGVLVMRQSTIGETDIPMLTILQEEVLDLRSSHIWVELRGLAAPLGEGDSLEFDLMFIKARVPVIADVHG
jgi:copper(I)-binding protein